MPNNNKYILEIETECCIMISEYSKSIEGLEGALNKVESFILIGKSFSAQIVCSNSKEIVWSLSK
jgi:hypothetical protein